MVKNTHILQWIRHFILERTWSLLVEVGTGKVAECELSWSGGGGLPGIRRKLVDTRCEWAWLITPQWTEVAGRYLRCVHACVLCIPTQHRSAMQFSLLSQHFSWVKLCISKHQIHLCSNWCRTYKSHWNNFASSEQGFCFRLLQIVCISVIKDMALIGILSESYRNYFWVLVNTIHLSPLDLAVVRAPCCNKTWACVHWLLVSLNLVNGPFNTCPSVTGAVWICHMCPSSSGQCSNVISDEKR